MEHQKFVEENNQLPMKNAKKELIEIIESKIDVCEIWLTSYKLEKGIRKYIDRPNRKTEV